MIRPDLHAAAVSLAALPEADAAAVLRESETGDESTLAAAIVSHLRVEQAGRPRSPIVPPRVIGEAGHGRAWSAGAHHAATLPRGQRSLVEVLPELCREVEAEAVAAAAAQEPLRGELRQLAEEIRRSELHRDHELSKVRTQPGAGHAVARYRAFAVGLFLVEAAGIYMAVAAALGVADGIPLAAVAATTWFQVFGLGTLVSVALFAATLIATRFIRKLAVGARLAWVGAGAAVLTGKDPVY